MRATNESEGAMPRTAQTYNLAANMAALTRRSRSATEHQPRRAHNLVDVVLSLIAAMRRRA